MEINWVGIILAVVSAMAIGAAWYSPLLFVKTWMKELKLSEKDGQGTNLGLLMAINIIINFIVAISLAMFIGPDAGWKFGMFAGFMAGSTFVSAFIAINYLYEQKSIKAFLINAGYATVALTVMGTIIGFFA